MPSKGKVLGSALETRVVARAREYGICAKKQPLSGVLPDAPNDVKLVYNSNEGDDTTVLVECKVRGDAVGAEKSVRVEYAWLDKVQANATRTGADVGVVVFNPKGGRKPMVLLDLDDFLSLLR